MKSIALAAIGTTLLALGLAGLVLPILPGFLFLLCAAACFASLSPRLRAHLSRHPRMDRFFHRVDAGEHLDLPSRFKLGFWAGLEAANPRQPDRWRLRKTIR